MNNMRLVLVFAGSLLFYIHGSSQDHSILEDKYLIILDIQEDLSHSISDTFASDELINVINGVIENSNPEKSIYVKQIHRALTISFKGSTVDTLPEIKLDSRLKIASNN